MNYIYKLLITIIPSLLTIAVLLFVQIFFLKIQLIAIYPATLLIFRRNTFQTIWIVLLVSFIYDAIFLATIGVWAIAGFVSLLTTTILFYRFQIDQESSIDIDKSLIAGCMITISTILHVTLYNTFTQSPHYTWTQYILLAVLSVVTSFVASSRHNASLRRIL